MTDPNAVALDMGSVGASVAGFGSAAASITRSIPLVQPIELLISCGAEVDPLRSAAEQTLARFDHFLQFDRDARFTLRQWSYHLDASRDEPVGHVADRSLRAVQECEGVIAIVGDTVPSTTRLEIRHVYELRDLGQSRELWFFRYQPTPVASSASTSGGSGTPLADFIAELRRDFKVDRIYHPVTDEADFVGSLIFELLPFIVSRTGSAFGPLTPRAAK